VKTFWVLTAAVAAQGAGNTCLARGMREIGAEGGLLSALSAAFGSPWVWVGTLCLLLFFAFFASALSWADLSLVLPASAFGYVVDVACAAFFLGERVSVWRWAGTVVIAAGVALVSLSARKPAPAPQREPGP